MRPIDADALIDKLPTYYFGSPIHLLINDAPTIQVEQLHGEWVDENGNKVPLHKDGYPLGGCWCNKCHEWLVGSDEFATKGYFCPNCGAKMYKGDDL